jgi:hypothetical protein
MPDSEHACRLRDPDEYDDFARENGAAEVAGREVDHVYGTEGDYAADLQSVRYPLANGWDTETALLDAQEHCESLDGLAFEPAEGFAQRLRIRFLRRDGVASDDGVDRGREPVNVERGPTGRLTVQRADGLGVDVADGVGERQAS